MAHRAAALAQRAQGRRDAILAFAEIAACAARRYKQWADAYEIAAEALEAMEEAGGGP